jgi:hypothetical protein
MKTDWSYIQRDRMDGYIAFRVYDELTSSDALGISEQGLYVVPFCNVRRDLTPAENIFEAVLRFCSS